MIKMKQTLLTISIFVFVSAFSQKQLPNIKLTTLDGKSIEIQDKTSNDKITVLSFWATWCAPCINELDAISDVYEDWMEETNVELIAISTDDSRTQKRIKPLINGKGWEFNILIDKNQELKRALNISIIPHIIILKNNKILYRHTGYSPGYEEQLYEKIKQYSK